MTEACPGSGTLSRMVPGAPIRLGRYELHGEIASGGMASLHLGCLVGAVGFSRIVAIKRLHPHVSREPEFVAMFLDEANLAARVRHPNVVGTIDVVHEADEIFLVMEYVDGESVAGLMAGLRALGERTPLPIVSGILVGVLRGLHAAHEARGPDDLPLRIVHRDISPQNILVGVDGVARLVDFGIAHANGRLQTTREGQFKGKLAYTAPELLAEGEPASVASDVYAAGLVCWELATGRRAFKGDSDAQLISRVIGAMLPPREEVAPWVPPELNAALAPAIARKPAERYASALEMATAIERALPPASASEIGDFVARVAASSLDRRRRLQRQVEAGRVVDVIPISEGAEDDSPSGAMPASGTGPSRGGTAVLAATPTPMTRRGRGRARIWPMALAGLLLVSAVGWFAWRPPTREPKLTPTTSSAAPPDPSSEGNERASTNESSSAAAPALSETRAPSSPAPRTPAVTRRGPPAHKPGRHERSATNPCDPPYTFDENGIQRVKRECFER
jgi:eukaryotic-like serine/threonine-protein kinase